MKKLLIRMGLITIFGLMIFAPSIIFAQAPPSNPATPPGNPSGSVTLENPLGDPSLSPQKLIGRVINAILGIVGSLALAMFIYGGFVWMLAAGSSERVQKGKDILVWATIGLVVIFASYGIVRQVFLLLK